jgi:hypothetical protein
MTTATLLINSGQTGDITGVAMLMFGLFILEESRTAKMIATLGMSLMVLSTLVIILTNIWGVP